ncbi:dihydrofolate reductase [Mycoplasmopsis synoviae]|uniref:dihydrofolate reductase n=2 Tax=Mycoplasmopsis synoviae TaxID=2109 RepID=Q4A612_MYCS5|nr:dihydrofolate reductase [Mycoplasmopsis synoviae]AAZ43809.1 dihydrofolate reductase [Mycoplasmopsis synoviae 53]AKB11135.1 dihydrofolate reductase [Mycoplasmopsis synoviae ATCC 25204]AKJ20619.1 Dihydrofolate reductase [Mycoplasmopsis synoviae]AQU47939.1 Dihydrofolate reductase [Mycoplasmopsis synoviae]AWL84186.1 dihydrofolate reductase [Mycoplasmopsis synoviae]
MIKLIVALDPNNLIGKGDQMPWKIAEEFKHFKTTTLTHSLLFGRNTFLGLPAKLENRTIYVLSKERVPRADYTLKTEQELFSLFAQFKNDDFNTLFIAGGKTIYEKYYKFADELIISRVKKAYEGDVYLNLDLSHYSLTKVVDYSEFAVEYYTKK